MAGLLVYCNLLSRTESVVMTTQSHTKTYTQELQSFEEAITPDERNAMRAYLQRSEVRLSTLHRIATAFIGGAGLLLLIPVFIKDAFDSIMQIMLEHLTNVYPALGTTGGWALTLILYAMIGFPLLLSLAIPLYGVYLLLKDVVHFYFTIYMPGFPANLLNPTFALTGVAFSVDESKDQRVKREVMRYQYNIQTRMDFVLPFSQKRRAEYFDSIIADTEGDIIPETRNLKKLRDSEIASISIKDQDVERFGAAFGIARSLDRPLVQEVAMTEMSLVRHVLYLRRLVLRYVKTLLMFIWTTLVSFMMLPILKDDRFPTLLVMALTYLVWSIAVMPIMGLPIRWIYRHRQENVRDYRNHVDRQLTMFEDGTRKVAMVSVVMASIGVVLAFFAEYA